MTVDVVDTRGPALVSAEGIAEHPPARRSKPARALRPLLVFLDAATLFCGWATAVFVAHRWATTSPLWAGTKSVTVAAGATVAGVATAALSHLYLARVCSVRTVEVGLLARVAVMSAVVAAVVGPPLGDRSSIVFFIPSMIWVFALLNVERGMFAYWVRSSRAQGLYSRPVVIIGTNDEGPRAPPPAHDRARARLPGRRRHRRPPRRRSRLARAMARERRTRSRRPSGERHQRMCDGRECLHDGRADEIAQRTA